MLKYQPLVKQETTNEGAPHVSATDVSRAFGQKYNNIRVKLKYNCYICNSNKYFELKNSWGADGAPQTRTTC